MHEQGLSEETVEPDFRLGIVLQLIALAVHLLEDEDEKVRFILVPFQHLPTACQAGKTPQGLNIQLCLTCNCISTDNQIRSKAPFLTQASLPFSALC